MRLIVLSKRHPQGRDLLHHPFGRFYHLLQHLADKGHDVTVFLLDYKNAGNLSIQKDNVSWVSINFSPGLFFGYYRALKAHIKQNRPDWVIGFSDSWYGIMAQRLAVRHDCRCVIDAYDDYESYIPWLWPLHYFWRKSLQRADVITAAGPQLLEKMNATRDRHARHYILPMAADSGFYPRDMTLCRRQFDLPLSAKLIGYAGSISPTRNLHEVFAAIEQVRKFHPQVKLVLSGRHDSSVRLPEYAIYKGYLADEQVPVFINAMDVMVSWLRPGKFAAASYPVKLYEAIACGRPIIARDTPPCRWILQGDMNYLASDAGTLAEKLISQLQCSSTMSIPQHGWGETGAKLDDILADRI